MSADKQAMKNSTSSPAETLTDVVAPCAVDNASASEPLRREFLRYVALMNGRYRYTYSKFAVLLGDKWPMVRQVVAGVVVTAPLSHVEIHTSEPCQLNCKYCRGQLRNVPAKQTLMVREELLRLIDHVHAINPRSFIRFSGTIGEPLLHPDICEAFGRIRSFGELRWGLTTNGLLLNKQGVMELLMAANYVHVSLDAGSDLTYQRLKGGREGDFEKVLGNISALAALKRFAKSNVEIVVSFLLQDENFREVPILSKELKRIGVEILELKMQHFDKRRHMTPDTVHEAYEIIRKVQCEDDCASYRVVIVQSEDLALAKIREGTPTIDFPRCFANQLGLNATVDPRGNLQTCCQYYQQTLGPQGHVSAGFSSLWAGEKRTELLKRDPRKTCVNCSPSDEFVNRFVAFLCKAHCEDPSFLSWVEENFVGRAWHLAERPG